MLSLQKMGRLAHPGRPSKISITQRSNCPRRLCLQYSHHYRNFSLVVMIKDRANPRRQLTFLRSGHRKKQIKFKNNKELIKKVNNLDGSLFSLSLQIKVLEWKHHRLLRLLLTFLLICWSRRPARTSTISFSNLRRAAHYTNTIHFFRTVYKLRALKFLLPMRPVVMLAWNILEETICFHSLPHLRHRPLQHFAGGVQMGARWRQHLWLKV